MASPSGPPIRLLLVDDHELVRTGLLMLLERHPGMKVVGEAATEDQALAVAAREQPDIILLDLDLGGESGLALLTRRLDVAGAARVILVTGMRNPEEHQRAVQLGAMGLVRKEQAAEALIQAIEKVHAGEVWLEPALVARALGGMARPRGAERAPPDPAQARIERLSRREHEVIRLVLEGLQNKQIAERLTLSETTVSHHLTSVFGKLGLSSRFDLIIYAYRHGLSKRPE
ncbi:MAG TPA: response regulator transcription factor [Chloroflexaceae bacterium]|nr:response regulator transcription factor [Chloroflexaceae bacterium]